MSNKPAPKALKKEEVKVQPKASNVSIQEIAPVAEGFEVIVRFTDEKGTKLKKTLTVTNEELTKVLVKESDLV